MVWLILAIALVVLVLEPAIRADLRRAQPDLYRPMIAQACGCLYLGDKLVRADRPMTFEASCVRQCMRHFVDGQDRISVENLEPNQL